MSKNAAAAPHIISISSKGLLDPPGSASVAKPNSPPGPKHSLPKAIVKCLDVDLELLFNYTLCLRVIVFGIMPRPGVGAGVRKYFAYSKLFRHHRPVFLQALESANEVREHLAVGVDKPI